MAQKNMQLALLIDYDNLMGFTGKGEPDPSRNYSHPDVVNYLETQYGVVVYCKAWGDWAGPRTRRTIGDLSKTGAEMQFVPHLSCNTQRIPGYTASCMGMTAFDLLRNNPNIGGFVFGSNDMALMPIITRLRSFGKRVYVLGPEPAAAAALTRVSDEFIALVDNTPKSRNSNALDKTNVLYAIKALLANGDLPIATLEEKLLEKIPEFNVADFGFGAFEDFLRNAANTTVKITRNDDGQTMIGLGNCHNASAYSDEELQNFNLAEYMQATRWHITDGFVRNTVLHNIYVVFSQEKGREMTNEDLRRTVDPSGVVEDRPWQGTIWSLIFGACLWENPKTNNQPQSRRLLSLFRTVGSEEEFMVRYYTSLFKKAYEDRPQLTPRECAELMNPDNVEGVLPLFERVFANLRAPAIKGAPAAPAPANA